jgi:hypothetical protein
MIFWTGNGLLAALFLGLGMMIPAFLGQYLQQIGVTDPKHHAAAGMLVAAALCWFVGRRLYRTGERVFVDKATGREFAVKPSHTFMFIPLHYFGVLLVAFAVYVGVNGIPESRKERRRREAAASYERELEQLVKTPNPEAVASAQQTAIKKYPDLGKADSPFNREFVALYKKYQSEDAAVLNKEDWPLRVADEVAAKLKQQ